MQKLFAFLSVIGMLGLSLVPPVCGQAINDPRDPAQLDEAFLRAQLQGAILGRATVVQQTQLAWLQNTGSPMPDTAVIALNVFLDQGQRTLQRKIAMAMAHGGNAHNYVIPFFGTMASATSPVVSNVNASFYVPDARGKIYVPDTDNPGSENFNAIAVKAPYGEFDTNLAIGLPPAAVVEVLVNPIDPFTVQNLKFEILAPIWIADNLTQFHFAPYLPPTVIPGIETSDLARMGTTDAVTMANAILAGAPMRTTVSYGNTALQLNGVVNLRNLALAPAPIDQLPVPAPDLTPYVQDPATLLILGKSLFWDIQVSSGNTVACATCHNNAGIDSRTLPTGPSVLNGNTADPDYSVKGSTGVVAATFQGLQALKTKTTTTGYQDLPTNVSGTLQITGRHTPSTINAAFNDRNFWDGRADRFFNGVNPFGKNDSTAQVYQVVGRNVVATKILIDNGSLASQAVGPVTSEVEMSWKGRTFPDVGRKLLIAKPLAKQTVDVTDGVLGNGVLNNQTYQSLIRKAFKPEWWNSTKTIKIGATYYTLEEANFSLFFGLAVEAYERTLVSSATTTRYDRWKNGNGTLTPNELDGLEIFTTTGTCIVCHGGPAFTTATAANVRAIGGFELMPFLNISPKDYDIGYYNIGVSPDGGPPTTKKSADPGLDNFTPNATPLSYVGQANLPKDGIIGAFKTPGLRNIEYTNPYMHNGRFDTLDAVIQYYLDPAGLQPSNNILNRALHPEIGLAVVANPLVDPGKIAAFLRTLSDSRVGNQQAPFDHPSLPFFNGSNVKVGEIPANGANGGTALIPVTK